MSSETEINSNYFILYRKEKPCNGDSGECPKCVRSRSSFDKCRLCNIQDTQKWYIDLYAKLVANKKYIICFNCVGVRSEYYKKLESQDKDILGKIKSRMSTQKANLAILEFRGYRAFKEELEQRYKEQDEEKEMPKASERERERGAHLEDAHKEEKRLNEKEPKPEKKKPVILLDEDLEDDERYWKENYTDKIDECRYCKNKEIYYIARKEDKIVRFCEKHHRDRGDNSEFAGFIFEKPEPGKGE